MDANFEGAPSHH